MEFEMSHMAPTYYVNCDARILSERGKQFPASDADELEHTPLRELAVTIMWIIVVKLARSPFIHSSPVQNYFLFDYALDVKLIIHTVEFAPR